MIGCLRSRVRKQPIIAPYFESENGLEFYNLEARNRYNQAPHLTQNTNGKVTTSQLTITNESQEVSPFPAGDHKASITKRARNHNKSWTFGLHERILVSRKSNFDACEPACTCMKSDQCLCYSVFAKNHR